jgi:hypothetical protein
MTFCLSKTLWLDILELGVLDISWLDVSKTRRGDDASINPFGGLEENWNPFGGEESKYS